MGRVPRARVTQACFTEGETEWPHRPGAECNLGRHGARSVLTPGALSLLGRRGAQSPVVGGFSLLPFLTYSILTDPSACLATAACPTNTELEGGRARRRCQKDRTARRTGLLGDRVLSFSQPLLPVGGVCPDVWAALGGRGATHGLHSPGSPLRGVTWGPGRRAGGAPRRG